MDADHVAIRRDPLDLLQLVQRASSPAAGAVVTFLGTTRDNFHGKIVHRLEYEAYEPMAIKELHKIIAEARARWSLTALVVEHRVGVVPVGEASVAIVAASVHRRDAIEAMHFTIDELKRRVPIFKKEVYADGSVWKANCEACHGHH